ncbi:uncharacterized protein CIMG_08693 [Coccidioides immitis RS]|uniref:Uncharacterized protein n=4 Tax=Coccidioides immitis TaxID=5501 RepID=A0A0E1RVI0_COCIM|nr:uncharacterized protein CIMG_08693 [Coccidioides immitis RS]EAS29947.1 hypothetical protein CIMG_08693 [Coccidioides immitis RS]KMP06932.1 hypothetical protein CIRG_06613 [Coccidioides immitis RMSCC 2394]KMU75181.1 hypothetical protein CISG_04129 [Coccidioides immitis RMSCC 3703]KMU92006.1 hypothetical protein CIHG_09777 [Coccidioides immitis H538.4]
MVGVPQVIVPDEKNTPQFSANNGPDSHGLCLWLGLVGGPRFMIAVQPCDLRIRKSIQHFSWGILCTPCRVTYYICTMPNKQSADALDLGLNRPKYAMQSYELSLVEKEVITGGCTLRGKPTMDAACRAAYSYV